jgi:hypothetical protein
VVVVEVPLRVVDLENNIDVLSVVDPNLRVLALQLFMDVRDHSKDWLLGK